jgi:hypothetical protein
MQRLGGGDGREAVCEVRSASCIEYNTRVWGLVRDDGGGTLGIAASAGVVDAIVMDVEFWWDFYLGCRVVEREDVACSTW